MNDDTISRQAAIDALDEIRHALWEIDIPSPTVPEYVEHHEQVQSVLKLLDKKQKELYVLPPAQPEACEYYALCRHGRDENKLRAYLGICEYCNEDSDGYVKPIEKNCHAFVRFGMNGWELSLQAKGWHGSAKIRYCPMCGRDLLVK